MDRRLAGLARQFGFEYTRYADDLTFSGNDSGAPKRLIRIVNQIVQDEGMRLNRNKTRVLRRSQRQLVTGVVVNQVVGLSRQDRRRLRAAVHQLRADRDPNRIRQLRGKLAYLHMLNSDQAAPLLEQFRAITASRS
jgi:RNA-directed DNA polymerase